MGFGGNPGEFPGQSVTQQFNFGANTARPGFEIEPGAIEGLEPTSAQFARQAEKRGRQVDRHALVVLDDPADGILFHYNPSEYEERAGADWTPKRYIQQDPSLEFAASLDTTIKCTLLFNDYLAPVAGRYLDTERSLNWVRSAMIPVGNRALNDAAYAESPPRDINGTLRRGARQIRLNAPPVLVLLRGQRPAFPCLLQEARIRETYFHPRTGLVARAEVDVTLVGASGAIPGWNPATRRFTLTGRVVSGINVSVD